VFQKTVFWYFDKIFFEQSKKVGLQIVRRGFLTPFMGNQVKQKNVNLLKTAPNPITVFSIYHHLFSLICHPSFYVARNACPYKKNDTKRIPLYRFKSHF